MASIGQSADKFQRAQELMRAGLVAQSNGNRRKALELLRRAAAFAPYQEQVWLALLEVLDDPRDRRVCLQNILAINPHNYPAYQQLAVLDPPNTYDTAPITERLSLHDLSRDVQDTKPLPSAEFSLTPLQAPSKRLAALQRVLRGILLRVILILLLGLLMALIISAFAALRASLLV